MERRRNRGFKYMNALIENDRDSLIVNDHLSTYLRDELLINAHGLYEQSYRIRAIKVLLTVLGSMAGVPSLAPAMAAAGKYHGLGYVFAGGTLIAYGAGAIWVFHGIVDEFKPLSLCQKNLLPATRCYSGVKEISCIILSGVASVIPLYTAYKYNKVDWKTFLAAPIGYAFNVFGFYKMINIIDKILSKRASNNQKTSILFENISQHIAFKVMPTIMIMGLQPLSEFNEVFNSRDSERFTAQIMALPILASFKQLPSSYYNAWPRTVFSSCCLFFPLCMAYVNATLAFEAAEMITSNKSSAVFLAVFPAVAALSIDSLVTFITAERMFDAAFNWLKDNPATYVLLADYAMLNRMLFLLAMLLAVLSSSKRGYVAYSTINNNRIFFTATSVVNSIVFQGFALTELFHGLCNNIFRSERYPLEQKRLLAQDKLNEFTSTIQSADPKKYQGFFEKNRHLIDLRSANTDVEIANTTINSFN